MFTNEAKTLSLLFNLGAGALKKFLTFMQHFVFSLSDTSLGFTVRTSHDLLKCPLKQWRLYKFLPAQEFSSLVVINMNICNVHSKGLEKYKMALTVPGRRDQVGHITILLSYYCDKNFLHWCVHEIQRSHSTSFPFFFFLSATPLSLRIAYRVISNFKGSASASICRTGNFLSVT